MPAAVPALVSRLPSATYRTDGVDQGGRETLAQLGRVPPVRGAVPAVEQPGLTEHERARADAEQPRTAVVRGP